jgi:integrase
MVKQQMPKIRNQENKGLPERWRFYHGAYYYRVPPGQEKYWDGKKSFRLGITLPEAFKEWAKRAELKDRPPSTINQLLDRYQLEVIPTKAPATQESNLRRLEKIRGVFGPMYLDSIRPKDIYGYADKRGQRACMRLEISLLSDAYTKAVKWGYLDKHPFKHEVQFEGLEARTRYVEDWEIKEALSLPAPDEKGGVAMIQAYIELKILLGLRQTDMLLLREDQMKEDGVHVTPSKTKKKSGKKIIFTWTDELRRAVAKVRAARPLDISPLLFCTRYGDCYLNLETGRAYGFASIWQRFMDRLLKETEVKESFAERDLRAKTASDAENEAHAQEMLGHTDPKVTRKHYRNRKPTVTKPLR